MQSHRREKCQSAARRCPLISAAALIWIARVGRGSSRKRSFPVAAVARVVIPAAISRRGATKPSPYPAYDQPCAQIGKPKDVDGEKSNGSQQQQRKRISPKHLPIVKGQLRRGRRI